MKNVYITSMGVHLPGPAINNDEIEDYLGKINNEPSKLKHRILKQNGIETRHYAIDKTQKTYINNASMAANSVINAIDKSNVRLDKIQLLATGTTQADLPIPGFGSMVHAKLPVNKCEIASFQSVCASGVMALNNAYLNIASGKKENAVALGSELASRLFKSSRFDGQGMKDVPFDTEFLRWMLSDGAGAAVLQDKPHENQLSLKIEWIDLQSSANEHPVVMFTGKNDNKNEDEITWLDYPSYEEASANGAINLKQDVRLLNDVIKTGITHYFELIDRGMFKTEEIDFLCCHYSSEFFKGQIQDLLIKGGAYISEEKWFSNLKTKGNTGSASIYIMLEELLYSGKLKAGQKILCMVPESGRFITSYLLLTVVGPSNSSETHEVQTAIREVEAPELILQPSEVAEWLVRQLTQVWINFETELLNVPIIHKIHSGNLSREDYKLLLHDLRQQVIDGSQWISRAASNIDIELFDLRSAFIKHSAAEHKDYQILERNWVAMGWNLEDILTGNKNIGSMSLSSFVFNQASKNNPLDLMGSMFIIEGIGKRLAAYWGELMQKQLHLSDDQVSFFTYHGVADENHFHNLEKALDHPKMTIEIAQRIVKTAKVTAKLYKMQLQELGNY